MFQGKNIDHKWSYDHLYSLGNIESFSENRRFLRKPRSALFFYITRTMFDLSPLAEGPSSLAESHSPLAEK